MSIFADRPDSLNPFSRNRHRRGFLSTLLGGIAVPAGLAGGSAAAPTPPMSRRSPRMLDPGDPVAIGLDELYRAMVEAWPHYWRANLIYCEAEDAHSDDLRAGRPGDRRRVDELDRIVGRTIKAHDRAYRKLIRAVVRADGRPLINQTKRHTGIPSAAVLVGSRLYTVVTSLGDDEVCLKKRFTLDKARVSVQELRQP
jgi:hypothetical protein